MATADSIASAIASNSAAVLARADSAEAAAKAALTQAASAVSGLQVSPPQATYPTYINAGSVTVPLHPTNDFSVDVKNAFDYAFGSFNTVIKPQILSYLTTFFPDIAAAVKTGSDQWIVDAMANGRIVPIVVENALWQRARDKEVADAARLEAEVISASAVRGFVAPPGVMSFTIAAIQEESNKKLQGINRDIAIKSFEVLNENAKFAIQQAVSLRTAFVSALGDFIKTAMVQPNGAVGYAETILKSKTALYDSAIRLYSAQVDELRVGVQASTSNQNAAMQAQLADVQGYGHAMDAKIHAATVQGNVAVAAAQTLANMAAHALGSQNTMNSISAGV